MRENGIDRIAFSSSGSVYGESSLIPTPEDAPFPVQTSLYGASKSAGEGLIAAYCSGFGFQSFIFRFVSILGERYTHGHVLDFYRQLQDDPGTLRVLGNGRQRKSYLYVHDCIDAMLMAIERSNDGVNIFNLGSDSYCEVNESIAWICEALGVTPKIEYTGGRPRMDRRQSVHFPGHEKNPCAGVEAAAHDSARSRQDDRIPESQSLSSRCRTPMNVGVLGLWSSWFGDGGLLGRIGASSSRDRLRRSQSRGSQQGHRTDL